MNIKKRCRNLFWHTETPKVKKIKFYLKSIDHNVVYVKDILNHLISRFVSDFNILTTDIHRFVLLNTYITKYLY